MATAQVTTGATTTAALIDRLGALPVEHGRSLCGLSMRDVYEQVRDSGLQAARQKQSEGSSKSQNLLRAYCKVRLALEELEQVAQKYGVTPRQLVAQPLPMACDAGDFSLQMIPETSVTAVVPFYALGAPMPSSTTSPKVPAIRRCRTTKDGQSRPLAVRSAPLPAEILSTQMAAADSLVGRGFAWIQYDLWCRASAGLAWMLHCAPLCAHAVWICAICVGFYLVSRPQLLVRFLVFCTEHAFRIATTSGSDLLYELDRVLLDQSTHVAKTLYEVDPIAWAHSTLFARPADFSALIEEAVSQATAKLTTGNNSHEDVTAAVKVAAKIAIDGAARQLSSEPVTTASPSEAPAGTGLVFLLISALTLAKAGKLLV